MQVDQCGWTRALGSGDRERPTAQARSLLLLSPPPLPMWVPVTATKGKEDSIARYHRSPRITSIAVLLPLSSCGRHLHRERRRMTSWQLSKCVWGCWGGWMGQGVIVCNGCQVAEGSGRVWRFGVAGGVWTVEHVHWMWTTSDTGNGNIASCKVPLEMLALNMNSNTWNAITGYE